MNKQDGIMFALYLIVFAVGVEMMAHGETAGLVQTVLVSVLFPLRLYMILNRRQPRE